MFFVLVGKASLKYRVLPLGYATTVLISSSLINQLQSGIRSRSIGRNAVEDAEYGEVSVISSEDGLNTCLSVGGREECAKQSLAAQGELLQPGEELSGRGVVRKDAHNFPRRPPLLGKLLGCDHIERLAETAGVGAL
jgi:hypothetical protein